MHACAFRFESSLVCDAKLSAHCLELLTKVCIVLLSHAAALCPLVNLATLLAFLSLSLPQCTQVKPPPGINLLRTPASIVSLAQLSVQHGIFRTQHSIFLPQSKRLTCPTSWRSFIPILPFDERLVLLLLPFLHKCF